MVFHQSTDVGTNSHKNQGGEWLNITKTILGTRFLMRPPRPGTESSWQVMIDITPVIGISYPSNDKPKLGMVYELCGSPTESTWLRKYVGNTCLQEIFTSLVYVLSQPKSTGTNSAWLEVKPRTHAER